MISFVKKVGFNKTRGFYFVLIPKNKAPELKKDAIYEITINEVYVPEEEEVVPSV